MNGQINYTFQDTILLFQHLESKDQTKNLRFAQLLGSGRASLLCANAAVRPIVKSANVRSTDILQKKNTKKNQILFIAKKQVLKKKPQ